MQIPVLIESVPGNGYRARSGEPFIVVTEGATPEDALAALRSRLAEKLREGTYVASVEIASNGHDWRPFAGMYQESDPVVREWLGVVQTERNCTEAY
jgi:hypothetical protein